MAPAFSTSRQAAAFAVLLLVLLLGPVIADWLNLLDRADVYRTLPTYAGPVAHIERQVVEESGDLDIAFIGSSFMWSAIDAPFVQDELSRALGRPAQVTVLASVWPGLDRDFAILSDLLAHRRVRVVVLQFPNRNRPTDDPAADENRVADEPHVEAFRLFRVGDFPGSTKGLSARSRASLYAAAVLGLPRHILSEIRPNFTTHSPVEATLGARLEAKGYYGEPYSSFRPAPPQIAPREMIFSNESQSNFGFFDEPLPDYQLHFAKLIASLLNARNVPAVLLHIPQANEIAATVVEERMFWPEATRISATMIGIPPARLFVGLSESEVKRFYASDHLNDNGAFYFTRVVMPALRQVLLEHAQEN